MREHLTKNVKPKKVFGKWAVWHRYTYGVAGERFFRELKDNARLVASVCPQCQRTFLPPNLYCEDCFVEMTEHRPVEGAGIVYSFTVLHESLDEVFRVRRVVSQECGCRSTPDSKDSTTLNLPIVIALVRWEGITGGWLGPLLNVEPEKARIGMRVVPVFADERTGQITDLKGFAPAEIAE